MSQAIESNVFPEEKGIYRVNEYWSTMVIRACESIDKVSRKRFISVYRPPNLLISMIGDSSF